MSKKCEFYFWMQDKKGVKIHILHSYDELVIGCENKFLLWDNKGYLSSYLRREKVKQHEWTGRYKLGRSLFRCHQRHTQTVSCQLQEVANWTTVGRKESGGCFEKNTHAPTSMHTQKSHSSMEWFSTTHIVDSWWYLIVLWNTHQLTLTLISIYYFFGYFLIVTCNFMIIKNCMCISVVITSIYKKNYSYCWCVNQDTFRKAMLLMHFFLF